MDNQLPADPNLDDSNLVPQPTPEEILDQSIAERQIQEQEFQQRQAAAEQAIRAQQEDPGQLQPISADQMAGVKLQASLGSTGRGFHEDQIDDMYKAASTATEVDSSQLQSSTNVSRSHELSIRS